MTTRRMLFLVAAVAFAAAPARARKCPNVLFVVDRSGSMDEDPNGGNAKPSKWELLRMGITATVKKYGDRLPLGLEMFTSNGGGQSCYTDTKIDVQVAHGTGPQIVSILNASNPSGGTNTGEAIKRAYTDGALKDASRGNYIVLITDGDPNCNQGDFQNAGYTVSEIANAASQVPSIHTFVVGFDGAGFGVNPKNLNLMADAGKQKIANCDPNKPNMPCYYSASTAQKFLDAVDKIISGIAGGSVIGTCDDSCFSTGCPNGEICGLLPGKTEPSCNKDACAGITCDAMAYCKGGNCEMPCPPCAPNERCFAGACVNDPCGGVMCPDGSVCDPKQVKCVMDKCAGNANVCPLPLFCDPLTGACSDDACRLIECPANSTCYGGWCMTDAPPVVPDLAMSMDNADMTFFVPGDDMSKGTKGGKPVGGCSASGGLAVSSTAAGLLLAFSLLALVVRRRRRA